MRANCIGVGDNGFPPADDQTIHFGTRAAPAMRFGATVTSPAGFSGQIGLLQLIKTDCIARTLPDHVVSHRTSGQDFVLDNHGTQVFGALIAVPAGQSVTLHATGTEAPLNPWNDTPWCTLLVENPPRVDGTTINEDRMRDYLMYRPEGADSIWVTLRKGGTWGWSAFAELNAQHVWVLREHAQTAPGITTPSNELPLWSSYFGALEFH